MTMRTRTYSEMSHFDTFEDRFNYLSLQGEVGATTFGFDRWLNQSFYTSPEWRRLRHHIIFRDNGCDLGVPDHEIFDRVIIHHITPMTVEDLESGNPLVFDPDNLICVSHNTHNAIHYGDASLLPQPFVERRPGDTKLW